MAKTKQSSTAISPKQTEKRVDSFSQALQRGESQSEAYREMHPVSRRWKDATVHVKASNWAKTDKVQAKLKELQEEAALRNETTVDTIDKMHKSAFKIAKEQKQPAAMTQSAQNLAKLHGLIVDKNESKIEAEVTTPRTLADFYT